MKLTLREFKQLIKEEVANILNESKYEKAAKQGKGKYVIVTYSLSKYLEDKDFDFDSLLNKIAKKYGGDETGSGAGFGGRDVNFEFDDVQKAERFINDVKSYGKKNKIKIKTDSIPLSQYYMIN